MTFTDDDLRRMWLAAGGTFYGPHVEHGTMPETNLLRFLRELAGLTPSAELLLLRPEVIAFARAMQFKLDKNAKKKGWPEQDQNGDRGWRSCPQGFLEGKLLEEVGELQEALEAGHLTNIIHEAADIGNIAMMLADNAGALACMPSHDQSVEHWKEMYAKEAHAKMVLMESLSSPVARPFSEWHEDMGPVIWWRLPVNEPPWVGTPLDDDWRSDPYGTAPYYTHFTPLITPSNADG